MKLSDEYTREDVRNLQAITFICIMIANSVVRRLDADSSLF